MNNNFLISICIPSYNRPKELDRLLNSIDNANKSLIQIVICEDKAPKRKDVRVVVENFKTETSYSVKYVENVENLGHRANFRECIKKAEGEFIVFMGDDETFSPVLKSNKKKTFQSAIVNLNIKNKFYKIYIFDIYLLMIFL